MTVSDEKASLVNLGGGAAVEIFDAALEVVLNDIQDPNSAESDKRKVVLTVTLDPKDRDYSKIAIQCQAVTAKSKPYATNLFIGKHVDGTVQAFEHNPEQLKLDFKSRQEDLYGAATENVTPIKKEADAQ